MQALAVSLLAIGKWIVDHLAPVATFTAALVALFKEDIVKRWRRPKLAVRMLLKWPDCGSIPSNVTWADPQTLKGQSWQGDIYYFRLWVVNEGPWLAERVQVYIRKISNRLGDNRLEELREFLPMNLRWSHSPQDKPTLFETLNPHMGKHCDLGSVSPTSNGAEKALAGMKDGESTFNLATELFSNNNCHRLKPGKYRIELLVAAQNARPRLVCVDLDWNGLFEESAERMFSNSVAVQVLHQD